MVRQPDIQYVRFYTAGSVARKLEPERKPKTPAAVPQPQARRRVRRDSRKLVRIDPVSLCAMLVAGVMLIAMLVGLVQLGSVNAQTRRLEQTVTELRAENTQLHAQYKAGYDLEDVEQKALAMGFVPVEQVQHITVHSQSVQPEIQLSAWEEFCATVRELFA